MKGKWYLQFNYTDYGPMMSEYTTSTQSELRATTEEQALIEGQVKWEEIKKHGEEIRLPGEEPKKIKYDYPCLPVIVYLIPLENASTPAT